MARIGDELIRPMLRALDNIPGFGRQLGGMTRGLRRKQRANGDGVKDTDKFTAPPPKGGPPTEPKVITLKPKRNWDAKKRAEFEEKVRLMNERDLIKPAKPESRTSSFRRDYIAKFGPIGKGKDVDHIQELQLGGKNALDNAMPLDKSVNRSVGSQIKHQIKSDDIGTTYNVEIDWGS
jgi:hypothetical protein